MKSIAIGLAVFCVLLSSAAQIAMKRGMGAPSGADVGATYLHALTSPMVWLGEPFSWLRVAGCTLIVVGVSLLAMDA